MSVKANKLLLVTLILFALACSMPHEPRVPESIPSSEILLTDATIGQEMIVVVTKAALHIYKRGDSDSYNLLVKKSVCEASALSVSQTTFLPSSDLTSPSYSVVIGCKDGYFKIYQLSFEKNEIVKSFSKKLDQPIVKVLSTLPYILVSTYDNIYLFSMESYQIERQIPISGSLSQLSFDEENKVISASDSISSIQIKLEITGVEVKRRPLPQRPILVRSRLLQGNQTGVCGDGTINTYEECDDGNTVSGDGCTANCTIEFCGDGIVNNNEQCDNGNDTVTVVTNTTNGTNSTTAGCTNCIRNCGNGVQDTGEECDDGNTVDGDGCSANCLNEKTQSFKAALGVGLGVSAVALVGVVAGTAAAPAGSGVASSLIGVNPTAALNEIGNQVGQNVGKHLGQNMGKHLGQQMGKQAGQQAGKALGHLKK